MRRLPFSLALFSLLISASASADRGFSWRDSDREPLAASRYELDRSLVTLQDDLSYFDDILAAAGRGSSSTGGDDDAETSDSHLPDDCTDGFIDYPNLFKLFDDVEADAGLGCFYELPIEQCEIQGAQWASTELEYSVNQSFWATSSEPMNIYEDTPAMSYWLAASPPSCPQLELDISVRCVCEDELELGGFSLPGSGGVPMVEGTGGTGGSETTYGGSLCTPDPLFLDGDFDGFGGALMEVACDEPDDDLIPVDGDCDDDDPTVNPSSAEKLFTAADDNCNGSFTN